jgi:nebulin
MSRYNADPGSIFDVDDPTDVEGSYQQRQSGRLSRISSGESVDANESDYELLASWDPKKLEEQNPSNWKNYLTGSYQRAYAPGSVMKYDENHSKAALQHVGYESSFYGSVAPSPAPMQQQEVEQNYISVRALYDYQAADDDEVSFNEGDIISQAQEVGGGWYFGVVERTGASGMLPGNYVQML